MGVEISTDSQWINKWKSKGCTTLDDVSRIEPNDPQLKKYLAEVEEFSLQYKFNAERPLPAKGIFMPKFILQPGKIYEIVHFPSVGASTVALNIGLDYIIKVFLEAELPEIVPEMTFIDLKGKIDMEKIENMLSDELESNKVGLDADQILDQLNLITFENSKSISESLILYLRLLLRKKNKPKVLIIGDLIYAVLEINSKAKNKTNDYKSKMLFFRLFSNTLRFLSSKFNLSIIYLRSITTKVQTDKPSIYKPSYDGMWKGFADENIFIYRYNYQIKTDFNRTS